MKLVHWPLIGGLLHLVQRGGAWADRRSVEGREGRANPLNINPGYGFVLHSVYDSRWTWNRREQINVWICFAKLATYYIVGVNLFSA